MRYAAVIGSAWASFTTSAAMLPPRSAPKAKLSASPWGPASAIIKASTAASCSGSATKPARASAKAAAVPWQSPATNGPEATAVKAPAAAKDSAS